MKSMSAGKKTKNALLPKNGPKSAILIAHNNNGVQKVEDVFHNIPPHLDIWANLFLKLQVEGIKAQRTLEAMKTDLNKFIRFFNEYNHSLDIHFWLPQITNRFVERLQTLKQKPKTISRALITLKSFSKWVLVHRPDFFQLGDPTRGIKPPTQEAMKPKGLSNSQVSKLLDAAKKLIQMNYPDENKVKTKSGFAAIRRPIRDQAIVMLLLNGGLRRQEVCQLEIGQLQNKHLRNVKCKGNMYRDILLGEQTVMAINDYLAKERILDELDFSESQALFLPVGARKHRNKSGRLSVRSINVVVETIAKEANKKSELEDKIKVHPHMFRHTHAYQVLKTGRSLTYVQKRLGHQSMNYLALYTQMPESEETQLIKDAEFK